MIAAESIHALLETVRRPGLLGLAGRKVEKQCEADLRVYFNTLAKQLEELNLGELVTQNKDAALHAVDVKLHNVLRKLSTALTSVLSVNMMQAYLAGDRHTTLAEASAKATGTTVDTLGPSGQAAADYAAEKSAELVTGLNATTRDIIRDAVSSAIEDRLGVQAAARSIRNTIDFMTSTRSKMIARTEMNSAWSQAALDKMKKNGNGYKQIVLSPDACEICYENSDADPLEVGDIYPSGDEGPPFHPNCRCAITSARAPEDSE